MNKTINCVNKLEFTGIVNTLGLLENRTTIALHLNVYNI